MYNWPFLMYWSKVLRKGINSVAWYHLTSYGFILAVRALSASGCCWLGVWSELLVSLTFHIPDVFDWVPSNTVILSLNTLRLVVVKVDVHPSFQSFPISIRASGCRWWKMCAVLSVWVSRGFSLSFSLWVAFMRLPSGSMTLGVFVLVLLLLYGVFTVI